MAHGKGESMYTESRSYKSLGLFQNSALTFADFLHKVDSQYSNVETVSGYPVKIQNGKILAIFYHFRG